MLEVDDDRPAKREPLVSFFISSPLAAPLHISENQGGQMSLKTGLSVGEYSEKMIDY